MKFKLKGSSKAAVPAIQPVASTSDQLLALITRSAQPLSVKDLAGLIPSVTLACVSSNLVNLRIKGRILNVSESGGTKMLALYIAAPPKSTRPQPRPEGMAIANCVSKMNGLYVAPAWESARPGADNFLRHQSRGF
jgi:hypothetical protein